MTSPKWTPAHEAALERVREQERQRRAEALAELTRQDIAERFGLPLRKRPIAVAPKTGASR